MPWLQMHPETCTGTTLLWNYEETMRLIQGAGNVAACFAGHTHKVPHRWSVLHAALLPLKRAWTCVEGKC